LILQERSIEENEANEVESSYCQAVHPSHDQRQTPWEVVNPKDEYPEDTVFYLRWLPRGAKNYSVKALPVNTSLHDAQVKCVSFSPQPVVAKPTSANKSQTLAELRKAFLEDKRTTIKSDGSTQACPVRRRKAGSGDRQCYR
jgi:hypothetical protein